MAAAPTVKTSPKVPMNSVTYLRICDPYRGERPSAPARPPLDASKPSWVNLRAGWIRDGKLVSLPGGDRGQVQDGHALAGVDLLLHRIGWSVQVPARQAAEWDEAWIAAWREDTWPVVKERRRTWAPG